MNTRIHYLYRDGANNKQGGQEILVGPLSNEQITAIRQACDENTWFLAGAVGLPDLQLKEKGYPFPTDNDHVWSELESIEATNDAPTMATTADAFYERFVSMGGTGMTKQQRSGLASNGEGKGTDNVERDALIAERDEARRRNHASYDERNRLVAWLAAQYPSSLERHPADDESWDAAWRWVVYIDTPVGQLSWHIRDDQLGWFDHVPRHQGRRWDGTTTADKYDRLAEWAAQLANRRPST